MQPSEQFKYKNYWMHEPHLVLMSSSLESTWEDRTTLEAVKSEAWSLMSSTILWSGCRLALWIWKKDLTNFQICILNQHQSIMQIRYKYNNIHNINGFRFASGRFGTLDQRCSKRPLFLQPHHSLCPPLAQLQQLHNPTENFRINMLSLLMNWVQPPKTKTKTKQRFIDVLFFRPEE